MLYDWEQSTLVMCIAVDMCSTNLSTFRYTWEMKNCYLNSKNRRISYMEHVKYCIAKAAFNKNRAILTSTLKLEMKNMLVKCYLWSTAFWGAETGTLRAVEQKKAGKFWNVVLEKDGEDQLGRSCEKWRSVTESQGAEEYPTWNE